MAGQTFEELKMRKAAQWLPNQRQSSFGGKLKILKAF
jgi:hypothetical protein